MLKSRFSGIFCILIMTAALILTLLFMHGDLIGIKRMTASPAYEKRLFDRSRVHEIEILMEDPEAFFAEATKEEYVSCSVIIDGEAFSNVGVRAKGNNSLRLTEKYGSDRYSLKLEFDHYGHGSYHGLDKFSLDASFQDNSYMKTWIALDMMEHMEVPTPLRSFTWLRINGEDRGMFLAVEEPEEAFARRNFGKDHGQLYKPDYKSLSDENADVHLRYMGDDPDSYENIFDNAKFDIAEADRKRLIEALRILDSGTDLERAVDVDEVIRYFTVQVFVVNLDSYLGRTGHNYFLYEDEGRISMLPWDYNLAFATYSLGMPDPINDAELYVNYPMDTPASGEVMFKRPLYHKLMQVDEYFSLYHKYMDKLISDYFESGYFEELILRTEELIGPYVEKDPTAFCSFEDHLKAVGTIRDFCILRTESIRGQLEGRIGSTIAEQSVSREGFIDASGIWLPDMGEIADLSYRLSE